MNNSVTVMPAETGYRDTIARAANDPNFNIDKFERLVVVQDNLEQRAADRAFNDALSAAQAEMEPIIADATNPQTRSRYATFSRLDKQVRPIYTAHGFSVSFNSEPFDATMIVITGALNNGMITRHYRVPMPIDTQGAKGKDYMTRTHATMSAITYGKRALLVMMFNLAIDADDDGNAAGGKPARGATKIAPTRPVAPPVPDGNITVDDGGVERVVPFEVPWLDADSPRDWAMKLGACLRAYCHTPDEVDRFVDANNDHLTKLQVHALDIYTGLTRSVAAIRDTYAQVEEIPA